MPTIACVVGARPNFVKMGPIAKAFRQSGAQLNLSLVHTGQHYDVAMSDLFFTQLGLPHPAAHLGVGSGSQGEQTAKVISRYESWLLSTTPKPDATLVVGDVNSTMACAIASVKLGIPVIHVEAGLRSFDRTMPEEINRLVTDAISELLLVSEPSGVENLLKEGRPASAIKLVGNVMIDSLLEQLPIAQSLNQLEAVRVSKSNFALWTMHRPSNVDDPLVLQGMTSAMLNISQRIPVVFPVHPRTQSRLESQGLWASLSSAPGVRLCPPLGYQECLCLSSQSSVVITDSGGLQEETTVLGIPCITLRENTERPITVSEGTSNLVGRDHHQLEKLVTDVIEGRYKKGKVPALWDGRAATRIASELIDFLR